MEVGLAKNWETTALQNLTTVDLLYFIMCEDPAWIGINWNSIWLEGSWPLFMILEAVLGWPLDTSFGPSRFHGHGSCLGCEVA